MRALIQRAKWGKVVVDGETVGEIGPGIVTLLAVGLNDTAADAEKIIEKISKLRIFEDGEGKMNLSMTDVAGAGRKAEHLLISQFTLYGDLKKGNRPSFLGAAKPEVAREIFEAAVRHSRALGLHTQTGRFQTEMEVSLLNQGPVTFWLESEE